MPARTLAAFIFLSFCFPAAPAAEPLQYEHPFFPGASHDPGVTPPAECLGFELGERAARPAEIENCLVAWESDSPRVRRVPYATTHEGRTLSYLVIATPERIGRLDAIRADRQRLADPAGLSDEESQSLLGNSPAVAWLGYSIHGDETSGSDAALAVIHHLAAGQGGEVDALLDELIVIIDPMMNPDGRHRFLQQVAEFRGEIPNVDDQSLVHGGYWPWGRTNHYLFDMNRDWLYGTQPETRGRMRAVREWHPQLFVDAHEMGSQDSYLFSPPRDPFNPHLPEWHEDWNDRFARDQAGAFDRFGWRYYTGEWNEAWYPGYSDAWASLGGAVGILYEQAGVADAGVLQRNDRVLTYRESVHHQLVSSMANLQTLADNSGEIKQAWLDDRRRSVSSRGPYGNRTWAVVPGDNGGRVRAFLDLMDLHGIRVWRLEAETTLGKATDALGRDHGRLRLPAGTLLVPNRQPEARRAAAVMEFDPRIPARTLEKEREKLLREGETRVYDVTAWNVPMYFGLEAYTLESGLPGGAVRVPGNEPGSTVPEAGPAGVAWVFPGSDDRSARAAAHLLQNDIRVRLARRDTTLGETPVAAGSPLVLIADNAGRDASLRAAVTAASRAADVEPSILQTGLGTGDLEDLGGEYFPVLERPRVALVTRGGISPYDFGAIWHHLDHRLALDHSHLPEGQLADTDLRRYNVIVLPDRWQGALPGNALDALRSWVESGGTLIAIGESAAQLAGTEEGFAEAALLPEVLGDLDPYRVKLAREWQAARAGPPDEEAVWSHHTPTRLEYPWMIGARADGEGADSDREDPPDEAALRLRDEWQALFMPQGAVLAARADEKSWLTLGAGDQVPVLARRVPVLMAAGPVAAPLRYGVYEASAGAPDEPRRLGWALLPAGHELRTRMSGLLWPEAAHRLANAAWLTRESLGRGQVLLFGSPPVFRGATLGTARILTNAILYGPGLGADMPIRP